MNVTVLTELEQDLMARYAKKYAKNGFPDPTELCVIKRVTTGAARYTYFDHDGEVVMAGGEYALGQYLQIDMEGLPAGLSFAIVIDNFKVGELQLVVNGFDDWDGIERPWSYVGDLSSLE
jgi:hypothetical protein